MRLRASTASALVRYFGRSAHLEAVVLQNEGYHLRPARIKGQLEEVGWNVHQNAVAINAVAVSVVGKALHGAVFVQGASDFQMCWLKPAPPAGQCWT